MVLPSMTVAGYLSRIAAAEAAGWRAILPVHCMTVNGGDGIAAVINDTRLVCIDLRMKVEIILQ